MYYLNVIETDCFAEGKTVAGIFKTEDCRKRYQEMTDADGVKTIGRILIDVSGDTPMIDYEEV